MDLLKSGKIPDPFYRLNEIEVKWVEEKDWLYRKYFTITKEFLSRKNIYLIFKSLDTFATIFLNQQEIGESHNMFIPWQKEIKKYLQEGKNVLEVKFSSPTKTLDRIESEKGKLSSGFYSARPYGRKAQCSFGWDWGPRLPTSGIWQDAELVGYDHAKIEDVWIRTNLANLNYAELEIQIEINSLIEEQSMVECSFNTELHTAQKIKLIPEKNTVTLNLTVKNPKLWWPNGLGEPFLYHLKTNLQIGTETVDSVEQKIGIRKIQLVQEKLDESNKSFVFHINEIPIFCKGVNWIPADSFLSRVTRQDYAELINLAIKANMNMFRIWGGGIYEKDEFYQLCDEKGIMVWQDFMFSCSEYPEQEWFWKEVKKETVYQTKRLRNHPSIVIWCGNNENQWMLNLNAFGEKAKPLLGEMIYNKILPEICSQLDTTRPYWPGSPFGGPDPNSENEGDRHNWDVWSNWKDYRNYGNDKGKFISEFGFQAPATMNTIESFTAKTDRYPNSKVMEHHNKQEEGTERLFRYLAGEFAIPKTFSEFVLFTQLVQGEALKCGIEHWRRRKFNTSGTLIWQINDCWPVTSWSLIDYFHYPKPAYYYVKRAFELVLVSIEKNQQEVNVCLTNDTLNSVKGMIILRAYRLPAKLISEEKISVTIPPNCSQIVFSKELTDKTTDTEFFVVLFSVDNKIISHNILIEKRYKHLNFPKPMFKLKVIAQDNNGFLVRFSSSRLTKGTHLVLTPRTVFSDNYFDLVPGIEKEITVIPDKKFTLSQFKKRLKIKNL